jgi:hypothetical protein
MDTLGLMANETSGFEAGLNASKNPVIILK